MKVFVAYGLDYKEFTEIVDQVVSSNPNRERPYIMGSTDMFEFECFDSELGKTYTGAEAIAMFIEYRREMLRD